MSLESPDPEGAPELESMVASSAFLRVCWFLLGWGCVALGGLGIILPGLPATGFFVGAAACFSRSSPRFEKWVLDLPGIGPLVRDYRLGLGMPMSVKKKALAMMWIAIGLSAGVLVEPLWVRLVIVFLGAVGSWVILVRTPTKPLAETVG